MQAAVLLTLEPEFNLPGVLDQLTGAVRAGLSWEYFEVSGLRAFLALRDLAGRKGLPLTAVTLVPPRLEFFLGEILAGGAARVVNIWDEHLAELDTYGLVEVLAAWAGREGVDLLAYGQGCESFDGTIIGPYLAEKLGFGQVTGVLELAGEKDGDLLMKRRLQVHRRELVAAPLPLVLGFEKRQAVLPAGDRDAYAGLYRGRVERLTTADLGLDSTQLGWRAPVMEIGRAVFKPPVAPFCAPDPARDPWERIDQILEGTVGRRQGRICRGEARVLARAAYEFLREKGLI